MSIKYEIHSIENVQGTGESRQYVQLRQGKAKGLDEMAAAIEEACTVTATDIKAVLSEFCHFAKAELAAGNRVYLPEIGYMSLAVGNVPPEKKPSGKITGKDIYVRNINFKPEAKFLDAVRRKARFELSGYTTLSARYTEVEMWQKVESYLSANAHITRRIMMEQFGLSDYAARQWLDHFAATGRLVREKMGRQSLYTMG